MFNPPHPGELLKEDILPDLGITVTEAAKQLGVTRVTFPELSMANRASAPIWPYVLHNGWERRLIPG
jgi:addiction module HigA family antidote